MADLQKEVEDLKARLAALEAAAKPAPFVPEPFERFDPTSRMEMPPSVVREMVEAVGSTMRDVITDNRHPVNRPSSMLGPEPRAPEPTRGSGWIAEAPLGPVRGIALMDHMMNEQDALDRAALAKRLAALPSADPEGD